MPRRLDVTLSDALGMSEMSRVDNQQARRAVIGRELTDDRHTALAEGNALLPQSAAL